MKEYKTVFEQVQKEIVINKSKFISHVKPIFDEQEALEFIDQIKSKYWDATHNVYAYILDSSMQKYSDDKEPHGTAGLPTLQMIKDLDLQNVVVVTTRYFGGTLLGSGGLVRAYRNSAKEGLTQAQIVTKKLYTAVQITIDYNFLGKVQSEIYNSGYIINNIDYEEKVKLEILLPPDELNKLKNLIMSIISSKEIELDMLGEAEVTVDESNSFLNSVKL